MLALLGYDLILILADMILGVILAIKKGTFWLDCVSDYLSNEGAKFITLCVVAVVASSIPKNAIVGLDGSFLFYTAFATHVAALCGGFKEKLAAMFKG